MDCQLSYIIFINRTMINKTADASIQGCASLTSISSTRCVPDQGILPQLGLEPPKQDHEKRNNDLVISKAREKSILGQPLSNDQNKNENNQTKIQSEQKEIQLMQCMEMNVCALIFFLKDRTLSRVQKKSFLNQVGQFIIRTKHQRKYELDV